MYIVENKMYIVENKRKKISERLIYKQKKDIRKTDIKKKRKTKVNAASIYRASHKPG